jgi:SAM-dependent methyltransferase
MSLYNNLSDVYDIVFPENPAVSAFLAGMLPERGRALDLACGTGTYALSLARRGHAVDALDLDGSMIEAARRKDTGGSVSFAAADMMTADELYPGARFDLVYCIGNSIVHLNDREAVRGLAGKARRLLGAGGSFVVQIVNYDRIMRERISSLPAIDRPEQGVSFIRSYTFSGDPDYVSFETELRTGRETIADSTRLMALRSGELTAILHGAGFAAVELYGGYDRSPHTAASQATIARAVAP